MATGVTGVFFIDLCALVFDCGCRSLWRGAAEACNIHLASGPHCPWCAHPFLGGATAFLSAAAVQAWILFRRGSMSLVARFALAITAAAVVAGLVGALQGWMWEYGTGMSVSTAAEVRRLLELEADPEKAIVYPRFFKTGPGEYGEGDRFYGVTVPRCRKIAKRARGLPDAEIGKLLQSPVHEERATALFVLVDRFERGDEKERASVYRLYRRHLDRVNNWDLVDGSAPTIVGGYLESRDRSPLYRWARSPRLWERRIAMLATFRYIKEGDFVDALAIARILLHDEEDLIHKAVGWMLREIGKRDRGAEEKFLRLHHRGMPRTMLRYAIEKFPERERKAYLQGRSR